MLATIAPIENRHEAAANPAEDGKAHRAIRIAVDTVVMAAIAIVVVAAATVGVVGLRVSLYALGHSEMPFFRDLLAAFGAGG